MTILIQDSFNRTDSTTGLGTADSGQTWSALSGVFGISSNQAYWVSGTTAIHVVESGQSDVQISLDSVVSSQSWSGSIAFRVADSTNFLLFRYSGSQYQLYKFVAGSATLLGSLTETITTGTRIFKVLSNGSSISCYVDDVLKISATETYNQTATKHGLRQHITSTTRYDNFLVESLGSSPTTQDGTASIIGAGVLSATATKIQNTLVSMLGTGTFTASPVIIRNGQTSIIGQGLLVANADTIHTPTIINGLFNALGTGFLTVEGEVITFVEVVPEVPSVPAITIDLILKLLFEVDNTVSFVSEVENKVSLTFNL